MVLLSQTLASLEKHPNNFEAIRVEAELCLAQIKFRRGETYNAYELIINEILPYALENGSMKFKLQVLTILGKICIQLSNTSHLMPVRQEEEKSAFDENYSAQEPNKVYRRSCLLKAANFLKQALPAALELNSISYMRECFYLLSLVFNFINQVSNKDKPLMDNKKEHSATLFLLSDQFIKQKQGSQSVHT